MCAVSTDAHPRNYVLSGVRIMWMIVLFDLPVGTPAERKAATRFRKDLMDMGFKMAQFSVYYKLAGTRDSVDRLSAKVENCVPELGMVHILTITDKQYENMVCFVGKKKEEVPRQEQLSFF